MTTLRRTCRILSLAAGLTGWAASARADEPSREGLEFFETKVRPVLVEQCYKCHSESSPKLKGGLLLDSKAGTLRGGESGVPSVVPGNPDKSKLIEAVRYKNDDLQMPPKEKLPAEQIAALEAWVKMGAPDPRLATGTVAAAGKSHLDIAANRSWWSFTPPKASAPPIVKTPGWARTPIDAFILAKLQEKNLKPSPAADRRTLIRRATFDLTGLPPTAEEVDAFESDRSPDAFAKVIDRLLASPRYGERWGRFWLDVARYADTKGYVFQEERRYPYSYAYRDWVLGAFNRDLPYDQFLVQQIAADRLPVGDDKTPLAAMGFLTVGRRFLNSQPDIIDDRIDVVCRGTMGLTVGCARCHDHKFDPIPTKDYYSLYGVFASSQEPKVLPALAVTQNPQTAEYEKAIAAVEAEVEKYREKRFGEITADLRSAKSIADYLMAEREIQGGGDRRGAAGAGKQALRPPALQRWHAYVRAASPDRKRLFGPWVAYAALPDADFAAKAPEVVAKLKDVNPLLAKALAGNPPKSLRDVADRYGSLLASFDKPDVLPDADAEALRLALRGPDAPPAFALADVDRLFLRDDQDALRKLHNKLEQVNVTHPGSPPRAMVLEDLPQPVQPHVFVRGNANNPGDAVPRAFPAILSPDNRAPFKDGSGRLELARAIASRDNPLTARVIVNRVWLHHFGYGIVRTPSDFGKRGEPPSHPELLDTLAVRFMEGGWSIKSLHRQIMLSAAYQQSSDDNDAGRAADPENRLLWKFNRQRLDLEATRDAVLAAAGQLDLTPGGKPVDILSAATKRRTVYGFIDRQNLPGLYRSFDFASPDASSAQRFFTTVPQQALFMMNSPFAIANATALARRPEAAASTDAPGRLRALYRLALGRLPTADEERLGLAFIAQEEATRSMAQGAASPVWSYGYGEVDEAQHRVKLFHPLTKFVDGGWQGGPRLPDPQTGWAVVTAGGGHPGNDAQHAVIRRWTAPVNATVNISGTLSHQETRGDGVRARILSSRTGELAAWTAHHLDAETKLEGIAVRAGDTIDFVVDCRGDVGFDGFGWAPVLRVVAPQSTVAGGDTTVEWIAAADFAGPAGNKVTAPPLGPWEKYAQVLLECNEFVFVD